MIQYCPMLMFQYLGVKVYFFFLQKLYLMFNMQTRISKVNKHEVQFLTKTDVNIFLFCMFFVNYFVKYCSSSLIDGVFGTAITSCLRIAVIFEMHMLDREVGLSVSYHGTVTK